VSTLGLMQVQDPSKFRRNASQRSGVMAFLPRYQMPTLRRSGLGHALGAGLAE
jgi:hypothetical protein